MAKKLTLAGKKFSGSRRWEYPLDYKTACAKYRQEVDALKFLQMRLKTSTIQEYEVVCRNIEFKRKNIDILQRWFRFTGNKAPEND